MQVVCGCDLKQWGRGVLFKRKTINLGMKVNMYLERENEE